MAATEGVASSARRGLDGRKLALVFVALALLLSGGAVYLNYRFTQERGALQQRLQAENHQLIEQLRARIKLLRERANAAADLTPRLDQLSQRLEEAAQMPATKYQQIGQACSEVENALYLLEQQPVSK